MGNTLSKPENPSVAARQRREDEDEVYSGYLTQGVRAQDRAGRLAELAAELQPVPSTPPSATASEQQIAAQNEVPAFDSVLDVDAEYHRTLEVRFAHSERPSQFEDVDNDTTVAQLEQRLYPVGERVQLHMVSVVEGDSPRWRPLERGPRNGLRQTRDVAWDYRGLCVSLHIGVTDP